jgi:16S rRNA (uracil1498-N3)-methyltransferase
MKIHRFIYPLKSEDKEISIQDGALVKQFTKVLKLKAGEHVVLTDGAGLQSLCEIVDVKKKEVTLKVLDTKEKNTEGTAEKKVILYASVLKKENFEFIAQKATEIGVAAIVPIISSRTIKTGLNETRLKKIIREATEQSGRNIVTHIFPAMDFKEALWHSLENNDKTVLFDVTGNTPYETGNDIVGAFVGPEGGWSESEISLARSSGAEVWSLGKYTLRGETAAIIGAYVALRN